MGVGTCQAAHTCNDFPAMTNQQSKTSKLSIIIVGAGLSGLSAAISCAQGGHKVLVVEAAKELAEV